MVRTARRLGRPWPVLRLISDGGFDPDEQASFETLLAREPAEFLEVEAAHAFLDAVATNRLRAPTDILQGVLAGLPQHPSRADNVIAICQRPERTKGPVSGTPRPTSSETFLLLAAAGASDKAILCRSQSGLWTLEVFVGQSARDREAERGYLLLSVHADHRATYEGRIARIFVKNGDEERTLAEETVRDGEVYAEISLKGLELRTRDAVNATFGPPPGTP